MESGETRFTLEGAGWLRIWTDRIEEGVAWMSQALSVFHALGVSLDDNLKNFELIVPDLYLRGEVFYSEHTRRQQPIHLFIRRLSPSTPSTPSDRYRTSALHYWSFDPTGRHPLSAETCNQLGLPTELSLWVYPPHQDHWDNESYRRIHEYQLARGFDPTTNDFARHLGYPTYSVQSDADRFEELPIFSSDSNSSDYYCVPDSDSDPDYDSDNDPNYDPDYDPEYDPDFASDFDDCQLASD
ncbi:hypothetical protein V5O48_015950 [Marasmius crinis-equi]|uniref:Uncharacterized protein n=1 Tax=Marasmius crinis-equi TaxID=585013 RepID=A0ABR3ET34_9AGAR